ncbi:MAG: amidophosphoribosyltransferase [Clostridium sp.]|uniref:amidophosphoribosyltransferase n=1 Tax=Clostridium sp. TaxID=1506 RepID=UPI0028FDC6D9|nr:amidophosphoribosyltransferase [Clostridium sp.]MDU2896958.1 amidophosphoribosyltransferase [Clostridium sp.]MDU3009132.1 amidophosphoribosyltransferase [Clostridium sp.]MDU3039283.1 amidophosphoribosyltransferase [Clostridium sp.]MDU3053411.1 amidophosphoribosyltransferase [Clostridium sp.]
MSVKRINSDKKSVANEGVVTMNNNEVNNFEEQETLMSNETVISEEKDIKEDEVSNKTKEENSIEVADAVPFSAKNTTRSLATKGVFTLVKAKTGNRAVINKEASEYLQNPSTLQFSYNEDSLIIGTKLPNNNNNFNVKAYKNRSIIYSVPLVREIAERFKLDFSNRTSMTFDEAEYTSYEGLPVLIIKIK